VFELQPPSAQGGAWTKTDLRRSISGGPEGITMNGQGVLYGVTQVGGHPLIDGKVFTLAPPAKPGGPWTETTLYRLRGQHKGFDAIQPPSIAEDGTIYATTAGFCQDDGVCGDVWGSVFALAPPSAPGGAWTYTLLYSAGQDWVTSPAVRCGDTIYATTHRRLLKIQRDPATGTWTTTTLHTFESDTVPGGPLVVDESGTIFGTAGVYPSFRYIAYSLKP
jgi:outer membrane protein assembly factor BamB